MASSIRVDCNFLFEFLVPNRKYEKLADVDEEFISEYSSQVGEFWTVKDPKGQLHTIRYKYNRRLDRPRIIGGWMELRDFYSLEGNCLVLFRYLGGSEFNIYILDHNKKQISYDYSPAPIHPPFSSSYIAQCDIQLTTTMVTGYKLTLPPQIGALVRRSGSQKYHLIGPSGHSIGCNVFAPQNQGSTKLGNGWRNFCRVNEVQANDILTFKFTSLEDGIVHVFIERPIA
ncbi:DNA-binding barrel domain superfamily [Sesbania bispinosa]|nr:DNA-binding barrel domain superfamily [Sesbania bispinosa]